MARFPDGASAEDLGLLHPGDDEFLQELLGSEPPSLDGVATLVSPPREPPPPSPPPGRPPLSDSIPWHLHSRPNAQGTDPWAAGHGAWPSLPPLEQAQSSASAGREASGDAGEQKSGPRQQQQGLDHQQLQSPRNGGASDGAPKSARQRRLEINRRSQTLYRERQKVTHDPWPCACMLLVGLVVHELGYTPCIVIRFRLEYSDARRPSKPTLDPLAHLNTASLVSDGQQTHDAGSAAVRLRPEPVLNAPRRATPSGKVEEDGDREPGAERAAGGAGGPARAGAGAQDVPHGAAAGDDGAAHGGATGAAPTSLFTHDTMQTAPRLQSTVRHTNSSVRRRWKQGRTTAA